MHSMAALETANSCVKLNIFSLLGNNCYFKNDFSAQVKVILLYSPFPSALRSQNVEKPFRLKQFPGKNILRIFADS